MAADRHLSKSFAAVFFVKQASRVEIINTGETYRTVKKATVKREKGSRD
jgi:hypothetical protein